MRERLDPLIAERAPWLFNDTRPARLLRRGLDRLLGYDRTVALGQELRDATGPQIMDRMADLIARDVAVEGLAHMPATGPALIVANHPTGIADGVVLWSVMRQIRRDAFFYANADILRVLPQMDSLICPVEWRQDKRTHGKTRETMAYTRRAMQAGRAGVIFPSGRLAKRRGLSLHERPWMASAAMIARKFDVPVVPVNLRARNSALFYAFDLLHPTLRDITLFHETLNKARQPYRIEVGRPIAPRSLPAATADAIEELRGQTLRLGGRHAVSIVEQTRRPKWVRSLQTGY
ncbi:glycerol acyltransferase [Pacificitalea manganoxidans]|uniref:Glycerol acyltransferase n=1 Tax=Pacificitalea manganoxidans TaxID=1411902 RepID=A0A291LYF8_9RHOB|nr:1-acyl-sn-glycerol-3-phosphate acyltransferase [Pacificitalea manganoxidans]ATI41729.1 glycerol acyltransferase [Pacificitalea manganoxidans]MAQ47223.1 glycerol acyltransferase [Actibacterium sp.]MBF53524.1 glycerol acyltransferase [Actibacterium sp.]MDR6309190.1 putative hemolysin [Pacificitalea manganoxidans]